MTTTPGPTTPSPGTTAPPTDDTSTNGIRGILRVGMAIIGPDRKLLALLCAVAIVVSILEVGVLYLVAQLSLSLAASSGSIEIGIEGVARSEVTTEVAVALAGALLLGLILLTIPLGRLLGLLSSRALERLQTRTLRAYLHASWSSRASDPEGHLQELMGLYSQHSERLVQQVLTIMVASVGAVALGLGAFLVSATVAAFALVGLVVIGLLLLPLARQSRHSISKYQAINKRLASTMAQTARLSEEIVVFNVADQVGDRVAQPISETAEALRRTRFVVRVTPLFYIDGALGLIVLLIATMLWTQFGSLAAVGPVVMLIVRMLGYLKQLQTAIQTGNEYAPYAAYLQRETDRLESDLQSPGGVDLDAIDEIILENVAFGYDPTQTVFSEVSFAVSSGEVIGLTGPSGSGKSTLSYLLLKLQRPTAGQILINGTNLSEVSSASWSRLTSFVPQDNELILATVADNIRFYRDGFDAADVETAARAAHLHQEIAELPDGYQTLVGPGERDLSGGQRQRLGIARALLGRPQLLVLDEPTSALDERSERAVRETLTELRGHTTVIIIAHRTETLSVCDYLLTAGAGTILPAVTEHEDENSAAPSGEAQPASGTTLRA